MKTYYWTKWKNCGFYTPDDPDNDYVEEVTVNGETSKYVMWPTNLMGQLRIQAQMSYGDASFIGYGLCFFILAILTIFFVFTYLKRVLYMAFLTMIAPLVALTYPIDKISDGQAQAFNKWLKEYIFNLLIQPLHLLIYTILVTSAFDLAGKNVLYSLAAIGFLIPAEKLMRSFFGFEKASTPGSLAGAAVGAGLINTGLQQLLHKAPSGKSGKNGSNGNDGDNASAPARIGYRGNDVDPLDAMAASDANDNDEGSSTRVLNAGGISAADSNEYNDQEDPVKRMEREDLEEKLSDGQLTESELTDDQKRMLGLLDNNDSDDEDNSNDSIRYNSDDNSDDDNNDKTEYSVAGDLGRKFMGTPVGHGVKTITGAVGNAGKFVGGKAKAIGNKVGNVKRGIQNNDKFRYLADSKEGQFLKGAGRAIRYTAKQGTKNAIRAARRTVGGAIAAAPNAVTRAAAGAVLGVTAGAIGTGVAIASGDPSNILTYGGGAALAAGGIGMSRPGVETSNTKSAMQIAREREFYGDKYDDHMAEKNMKNWKRDDEKRQELERYLGREQVKSLYKDNKIDKYLKNEITDAKDIAALEKLQKEKSVTFNDAMVFYDAYDKYGDITRQKPKDRTDIESGYTKEFTDRGNSQQRAEGKAKRITKMTHEFESYKKDLR